MGLSLTDCRTQRTPWASGKKERKPFLYPFFELRICRLLALLSYQHFFTFRDLQVNKDPEVIVVTKVKK